LLYFHFPPSQKCFWFGGYVVSPLWSIKKNINGGEWKKGGEEEKGGKGIFFD